jgi:maltose O-acetyltransferase
MRTEKDKMLAGELYDPLDPELVQARERARDLCQDLNATRERDSDARRAILNQLFGQGGEKIGDFTLFGPAVQIYTATHPMNAELRRKQEFAKPIEIGSDVWVGGGAIICPGVKIGSKAVIGAGSVVTRDIPSGVFAAGNPCRVIRGITE